MAKAERSNPDLLSPDYCAPRVPMVDFVVMDECHLRFKAMDDWMDAEPEKIFVGLTATPWSIGLGDRFDDLIIPTSIDELTRDGFLSPLRAFAPTKPDLTGIKMIAGDFHEGQLAERMSGKSIVADVVTTWLDKGEGCPTLLFAVDRAHADVLQRQFAASGVPAAYVDANTEREERTQIGRALERGEIKVICSVGTMTTGVDLDIRCISYCRPTKSEILWVQSIGRGLRIANGKSECILLITVARRYRSGCLRRSCTRNSSSRKTRIRSKRSARKPKRPFRWNADNAECLFRFGSANAQDAAPWCTALARYVWMRASSSKLVDRRNPRRKSCRSCSFWRN